MELFHDPYVQAIGAAAATWLAANNLKPAMLFRKDGKPKYKCVTPETLAAIAGILALGYRNGLFSRGVPGASSGALAVSGQYQAMMAPAS